MVEDFAFRGSHHCRIIETSLWHLPYRLLIFHRHLLGVSLLRSFIGNQRLAYQFLKVRTVLMIEHHFRHIHRKTCRYSSKALSMAPCKTGVLSNLENPPTFLRQNSVKRFCNSDAFRASLALSVISTMPESPVNGVSFGIATKILDTSVCTPCRLAL